MNRQLTTKLFKILAHFYYIRLLDNSTKICSSFGDANDLRRMEEGERKRERGERAERIIKLLNEHLRFIFNSIFPLLLGYTFLLCEFAVIDHVHSMCRCLYCICIQCALCMGRTRAYQNSDMASSISCIVSFILVIVIVSVSVYALNFMRM